MKEYIQENIKENYKYNSQIDWILTVCMIHENNYPMRNFENWFMQKERHEENIKHFN